MDIDWKQIVRTVAPAIAGALGTPAAAVAVAALSQALLGHPDATEAEVAAAVAGGGPETVLKLKEADHAFRVRMRELDTEDERIHAGDRASAREREAKAGDSRTPRWLAVVITAGFFIVLLALVFAGKPKDGGDALLIMLGALGAGFGQVLQYYFGSSSSSAQKNELLARAKL